MAKKCLLKEPYKGKMQELIDAGVILPTLVSMSEWYYMRDHAKECEFCANKFEKLAKEARKNGPIDGPTTLR